MDILSRKNRVDKHRHFAYKLDMKTHPQTRWNKQHELSLDNLQKTGELEKSYIAAGYTAKNKDIARQNALRLVRTIEAKMQHTEIMAGIGLTGHKIAKRMLDIVDSDDPNIAVRGLNLATRCLQWQQPNIQIGVGVEINITGVQAQADPIDDVIDVTASALDELPDEDQVSD